MLPAASPTGISTLSLHDALPILGLRSVLTADVTTPVAIPTPGPASAVARIVPVVSRKDRKSTRLNSSHRCSSYAVFCWQKNKLGKVANAMTTRKANDTHQKAAHC